DWETGQALKTIAVKPGTGGLILRGDELMLVDNESGRPFVMHIDLESCQSRTEDLPLGGDNDSRPASKLSRTTGQTGGTAITKTQEPRAGLPLGVPGKDAGQPMDPAKVAQQAQRLSLPSRLALPATLAGSMN